MNVILLTLSASTEPFTGKMGIIVLFWFVHYVMQQIGSDGEINICMEYMDGGSLDLVIKKAGKIGYGSYDS